MFIEQQGDQMVGWSEQGDSSSRLGGIGDSSGRWIM